MADRKQRVVLNGAISSWLAVKIGVLQGSVLGQVLFIIYVNDIDSGLSNKIYKFAVNTKFAARVKDCNGSFTLQRVIDKLISWADKWQM